MKLFTVGPVEMFPEMAEITSKQLPYFRTEEFSALMLENEVLFKESIWAPADAKTIFLTASGTAAMEAAVINCFDKKDRLLVINGGGFGKRFAEICQIHRIPHDILTLAFGEVLTREKLDTYSMAGYTGLLVNLHETTTGQLYDIHMLAEFCEANDMYFVADGISTYGADAIHFQKDKIDVLIVSSQKALALAPGLSIVVVSDRIYRHKILKTDSGCMYLDFKMHMQDMKRGQTPFTPAVEILLALNWRLKQIRSMGMEKLIKRTAVLADSFRKGAKEVGFKVPDYPLSNALTPLILEPDARMFYERLKEEYGLVVTPSGGELENKLIRVGHLGNLCEEDYDRLLEAMKLVRESL